jgi:hypothetical protein
MEFFCQLGLRILDRWRRADLDQKAFPDIAANALVETPPSAHVDPLDVVRWVHADPLLVPQAMLTKDFGQPPITVFQGEGFYIDVLFWVDATTQIHQHGFSGAFHLMQGSSLQSAYRFTPRKRYSERLLLGDLALERIEVLGRGDVRPIFAGAGLVHALFHLDRPSVSVVVRTRSDAFAGPQYSYSRAGLAWDPFYAPESMTRKVQTVELLHKIAHPEIEEIARASIVRADAFVAFRLLETIARLFDDPQRFSAFVARVDLRHEGLAQAALALAEDARRERYLIARRRLAKQASHRFLLALLLNLAQREPILKMVAHAYPERDPVTTVLTWLGEIAQLDAIHAWVADAARVDARYDDATILDVKGAKIDEKSLQVARELLEGTRTAAGDHAGETENALRQSLLLRPLFCS